RTAIDASGRSSARRIYGGTFWQAVHDSHRLPAASQSVKAQSEQAPCAQACRATCKKHLDEELPPDQSGENRSVRNRNLAPNPRIQTNSVGRSKAARPTSRFLYSKPP